MTLYDFALAAGPPVLAIALERWSIPGETYLASHAAASAAMLDPDSAYAATEMIRNTGKGAVALSSLAPTFVSYVTSLFALFNGEPDAVNYIYVLMALGAVVAIALGSAIQGRSPIDIAVAEVPGPWKRLRLREIVSRAKIIHWTIYIVNGMLFVIAILVYAHLLPRWK